MNANDSGVAKWSVLRNGTYRASGSAATSASAGLGEVVIAEGHEHRAGDAANVSRCDRPGVGPSQHGRERQRVVALDVAYWPNRRARLSSEALGSALDPGEDPRRGRVVALEDVAPDAGEHEAMEAVRGAIAACSSVSAPSENPTASTGPSGRASTIRAVRSAYAAGSCGFGRGAVAEQVDADHLAAGVGEQGGEAAALPGRRERATPPVHEDHRDRHGPAA